MADHAGTERDMLLLDRYGDDNGSGDTKNMRRKVIADDDSSDDDKPPKLTHDSSDGESDDEGSGKKPKPTSKSKPTSKTNSKSNSKSNSKAKSSSVCSRLRPLREIAHRSERDSHGRTSPTPCSPTPALTLTSPQE